MTTFNGKVEMSLENWGDFVSSIKEIHNLARCPDSSCDVGTFIEKLDSHTFSSRRSPCLVREFFINLCRMYPKALDDVFIVCKNKEQTLQLFRSKYQNEVTE